MNKLTASFLLLLTVSLTVSCGSSRKLQSITISQTVNGQQIEFVATGTFSSAPTTVTTLPVAWSFGLLAPPPPQYTYALTTQPFVVDCTVVGPQALPVSALAPSDPRAPSSGSTKKVVTASMAYTCP
jgi:hypothetical protein